MTEASASEVTTIEPVELPEMAEVETAKGGSTTLEFSKLSDGARSAVSQARSVVEGVLVGQLSDTDETLDQLAEQFYQLRRNLDGALGNVYRGLVTWILLPIPAEIEEGSVGVTRDAIRQRITRRVTKLEVERNDRDAPKPRSEQTRDPLKGMNDQTKAAPAKTMKQMIRAIHAADVKPVQQIKHAAEIVDGVASDFSDPEVRTALKDPERIAIVRQLNTLAETAKDLADLLGD